MNKKNGYYYKRKWGILGILNNIYKFSAIILVVLTNFFVQMIDNERNLWYNTDIKIIYYGHDLHYLREQREAELNNDKDKLTQSNKTKELEELKRRLLELEQENSKRKTKQILIY